MCGFAGFLDRSENTSAEDLAAIAGRMAATLVHRGPDDGGVWTDAFSGLALGHRRLSILDLSAAGHQPMLSRGGRYVVAFNGEIYNHLDLRRELEGGGMVPDHPLFDAPAEAFAIPAKAGWRGHSDTETLLAAVEAWGVGEALKRCVGMFAFALWDRHDRVLYLARDRLGEKPLYYGWQDGMLLFGSELKAFKPHPAFKAEIDRSALSLLLRYGYIPAPYTIYQGIKKLPPGTFIALSARRQEGVPVSYWSARDVALRGQMQPFAGTGAEAVETLDGLLRQAVAGQMLADVPLGAFLSGGFDSSTVVALMQAQSSRPVRTFSIGFHETGYNEAGHAKAVAAHLGTDHTELYVTPEQAMAVIPNLPTLYDEPFADSSQIPTFLVSQLARGQVTVSLSGDGGDEVFCGYARYPSAVNVWRRIGYVPSPVRAAVAAAATVVPPHWWDALFRGVGFALPGGLRAATPGDKLRKLALLFRARQPEEVYRELVSQWKEPARVVRGAAEPGTVLDDPAQWPRLREFEHRMMFLDTVSYLPDDILVKVDRAAMGVSLETRVPLLDHRVVEFAWSLPASMKLRDGVGKWPLRQVLYRYVPKELMDRPKMGFGVPIDQWLRGPLKDWAGALLDRKRLKQEGYFNAALVHEKWTQHLAGRRDWSYYLWDVLMFQAWREANP
ncbi:asparagine synthase (glutamine-hydrolyzing) [Methylomagnum ishizawai]|uniref:asparagine synthase (glutamine-hydrolyzing) n=1 Tax=Methylomagnum ishizawai TaxID=1760988 RepID=UPI001C33E511|nr:asparagine synthase (glutamine-hydrolyzing) [Methylomagnum ishizawai]BBL76643.1 asparagine synthetase B [Methylomagnum ishizawai]